MEFLRPSVEGECGSCPSECAAAAAAATAATAAAIGFVVVDIDGLRELWGLFTRLPVSSEVSILTIMSMGTTDWECFR